MSDPAEKEQVYDLLRDAWAYVRASHVDDREALEVIISNTDAEDLAHTLALLVRVLVKEVSEGEVLAYIDRSFAALQAEDT